MWIISCQCDLAGGTPIAWIWPATQIPELLNALLWLYNAPAQVGAAAASGEISWRDIFVCSSSAELIEVDLVRGGVAAARFSNGFSEGFPKLWCGFSGGRSERTLWAVGFIISDQKIRNPIFPVHTPLPSCVPAQAFSVKFSSVCHICLSNRGFAIN